MKLGMWGLMMCVWGLMNAGMGLAQQTQLCEKLQWNPVIHSALKGYNVYVAKDGVIGNHYFVEKNPTEIPCVDMEVLAPGATWTFTVTAITTAGKESGPSVPVDFVWALNEDLTQALPVIASSAWTVFYADSEETVEDNKAANAFDQDPTTIWHTQWNVPVLPAPGHPHHLVVDLGAFYDVQGFRALPRQDGGANGRIGAYELLVPVASTTPTMPLVRDEWEVVHSGTMPNNALEYAAVVTTARIGRYVWLRVADEAQGAGNTWTSLAELTLLGVFDRDAPTIPLPGPLPSPTGLEIILDIKALLNGVPVQNFTVNGIPVPQND